MRCLLFHVLEKVLATTSLWLKAFRCYLPGGIGGTRSMDVEQMYKEDIAAEIRSSAAYAGELATR